MGYSRFHCWLVWGCAALAALVPTQVWAQRISFPTQLDGGVRERAAAPATSTPSYFGSSPTSPSRPGSSYSFARQPTYDLGGSRAALNGTIEPSPTFDPYAVPGEQPPILLNDPYGQPIAGPGIGSTRLLQNLQIENSWLARIGDRGFGVNTTDLNGTFALPFAFNPTPFLITPGFTYHSWDGPSSGAFAGSPDLPARAYDAYLDSAWRPQITEWLAADLGLRVGVYSDFNKINTDSVRFLGRALGVATLSPEWQVAVGVAYLDRLRIKILPAGGLIWTPSEDRRFEILFPNPKLAFRWTTIGNTDVWWYVSGEYGGGSWTIERADGANDRIDYNDLRVNLGLEGSGLSGWHAWFEVGYVFDREILYISGTPDIEPRDTVMLRAGLSF